jgi:hypothetical protein
LEHPAATSLLPLARISKSFVVNYILNNLVGSINVNNSKLIKLKGNLAFPRKPSHPRGLLRGAPPQKMVPFFAKNSTRKHAKVCFDLGLERIQAGRRWPSRKDARARDSLRLREDTTLLSCLRPSGLLTKTELSQPEFAQAKEKRNNAISEKRNTT